MPNAFIHHVVRVLAVGLPAGWTNAGWRQMSITWPSRCTKRSQSCLPAGSFGGDGIHGVVGGEGVRLASDRHAVGGSRQSLQALRKLAVLESTAQSHRRSRGRFSRKVLFGFEICMSASAFRLSVVMAAFVALVTLESYVCKELMVWLCLLGEVGRLPLERESSSSFPEESSRSPLEALLQGWDGSFYGGEVGAGSLTL